jgi:NAD(P)-dependent dehydrogenase (short-subunit alcohol dehydrogenase family)
MLMKYRVANVIGASYGFGNAAAEFLKFRGALVTAIVRALSKSGRLVVKIRPLSIVISLVTIFLFLACSISYAEPIFINLPSIHSGGGGPYNSCG